MDKRQALMDDFRSLTEAEEVSYAVYEDYEDICKFFQPGDNPYPKGSYLAQVFTEAMQKEAESIFKEEDYRDYMDRTGPQPY